MRAEEAIEILEKGVELDSSSTHSLWNLSLAYLLLGRYKEGWRYYEARFNCPDFVDVIPPTSGIALQSLGDRLHLVKKLWLYGVSKELET